ncbi:MAG TPA: cell division protein FtsA [Candidatus Saccharibacteria bacterium]|nr:cell division protein FtsA [Candidatus Saccharibacteria bacterium]
MSDQATTQFIGLDIGTSTVRCVVGSYEAGGDNILSIIGHGSAKNLGMRKGNIVHPDDVASAIVDAVTEAERVSGRHITNATVNINGSHVVGMNSRGVIAISSANREITADDRLRVEEAATIVKLPPNREIIQVFAKNYRLDGQDNIKDPVGMQGVRLEVDTHIVTAATPNLRNLELVLEKAKVVANHQSVSSLAATEAVLTREQKEAGTLLLDIGAGTTNMIVLEEGEVQHTAVLPIGGIHITNDLAIGLKTDLDIAEQVKLQHGGLAKHAKTGRVSVVVGKNKHDFDAEEVHMIIEARVEELLEYVDKELRKIQRSRKLPGGVVLVGGTSKLLGIDLFAKEKLELAARVGRLQPLAGLLDTVQDPSYSTAVGLMLLDMLLGASSNPQAAAAQGAGVSELVGSLFKRFRK